MAANFQLERCAAPQRRVFKVPKASELATWKPNGHAPSDVTRLLDVDYVLGVDIETHDWVEHRATKGSIGQFGFYCLCDPDDFEARIIQIGWSMGPVNEAPVVKEFVIQPVEFIVAPKAEKYHGISHERALLIGKPLRDVLQELLVDMRMCSEAGGRIAAHHLEFDCGIIAMELRRAGLEQHCVDWANFSAKGICTLSPAIGKWVCQCVGRDTGPENKMNTLRLSDLVDTLLPGHPLKRQMHTAGADAQMHRLLVIAMQKLLKQQTSGT